MSNEQDKKAAPIQLQAGKSMHIVHDGSLTGAAMELESRRLLWWSALRKSIEMLSAAIRSHEHGVQTGATWNGVGQTFPTPSECFTISRYLTQMAVITFMTMFNKGFEDKGNVAGNLEADVESLREACLQQAFPEASDRAAFDALFERLKAARDGNLAHADGSAQGMEHYSGSVASFGPLDGGAPLDEVRSLLPYAERLLQAVDAMRQAGKGMRGASPTTPPADQALDTQAL
ncbi:hypothetical protein [Ralstonia solanacearum]|uniref:Uncharacterized protein n=1 Tax=Ralstonia solanacearum TaxID=305 RepID=A0AAE3NJ61_RALSL|nr:hypothetical protein [Ralstonia solanacearum]MBB6582227.1 hypothetical protein [Ralstonia solanacearum]MDB0522706.1 hypothetical protein [Ralstonia solanacearum]